MKKMKNILAFVVVITVIFSTFVLPVYATTDSNAQNFDFADLAGSYSDGKIPATMNNNDYAVYGGTAYVDDQTGYNQPYWETTASGDKGIKLVSTVNGNFGFAIKKAKQLSGTIEIGCKVKIDDLLATRTFGSYDSHSNSTWLMKISRTNGYMYVVGKGLSKKAAAGDVLDAKFIVNLSNGEARAIIKKNDADWIDETNTVSAYTTNAWSTDSTGRFILMYQTAYGGSDNTLSTSHWSNIYTKTYVAEPEPEKKDIEYTFDDITEAVDNTWTGDYNTAYSYNTANKIITVALDADGGKRLKVKTAGVGAHGNMLKFVNTKSLKGTLEMGFDLEVADLNADRMFGAYECPYQNKTNSGAYMVYINKQGNLLIGGGAYNSAEDNTLSVKTVSANDKLNFKIWLDTNDGWMRALVTKNNETWIDTEIKSAACYDKWIASGKMVDMFYYHTGTLAEDAVTYFDNYYLTSRDATIKNIFTIDQALAISENTASFKASTSFGYTNKLMLVIAEYSESNGTKELTAVKIENISVNGESKTYSAPMTPNGGTVTKAFLWQAGTLAPISTVTQ